METALLKMLCAPESLLPLRLARADELTTINAQIRRRALVNRNGVLVDQEVEDCLICDQERRGFPVRHGLPVLLASESFSTL